jgi:hypothetical protein
MGGFGSGSYARVCCASKCEHHRCIDLATLRRWRMLKPGSLRFIRFGGKERDCVWALAHADGVSFIRRRPDGALGKLFVSFVFTTTAFNGQRPWFCCPGCGRRCRCLYGADSLRCRICLGLKYASQSEQPHWRSLRRADAIRQRLGGEAVGVSKPFPDKPKRMRWKTYATLRHKDYQLRSRFMSGAADVVSTLSRHLGRAR